MERGQAETNQWCDGYAVGRATIEVLVMVYSSQVDHRINESALLWPSVHLIGVCDLHWSVIPMIAADVLCAFCGLVTVGRREGFGLYKKVQEPTKVEVK